MRVREATSTTATMNTIDRSSRLTQRSASQAASKVASNTKAAANASPASVRVSRAPTSCNERRDFARASGVLTMVSSRCAARCSSCWVRVRLNMRANGRSRVRPITIVETPLRPAWSISASTMLGPCSSSASPPSRRASANALVELALRSVVEVGAGLHADHAPRRIAPLGHAPRHPHQVIGLAAAIDRHQHASAQRAAGQPTRGLRFAQVAVDAIGSGLHRQFAQRGQVGRREERLQRMRGLVRHVDLALLQALDQLARRQVDQHDVAQAVEDEIRHGLADAHAGDPVDHVVEAFQVLDVDRGVDVDAGIQQFHHVLPTALVAAAGDVAMRQFVHQRDPRLAGEQGVEIKFLQRAALMLDAPARQHVESVQQRLRLHAAVRLDQADDHVGALLLQFAPARQHRVGLAHTGCSAEEDGQPPAALALQLAKQRIGLRLPDDLAAIRIHGRIVRPLTVAAHPAPGSAAAR
jgi:predicted transcriptional regulator